MLEMMKDKDNGIEIAKFVKVKAKADTERKVKDLQTKTVSKVI